MSLNEVLDVVPFTKRKVSPMGLNPHTFPRRIMSMRVTCLKNLSVRTLVNTPDFTV